VTVDDAFARALAIGPFRRQHDAVRFDHRVNVLGAGEATRHVDVIVVPPQQVVGAEIEVLDGAPRGFSNVCPRV